MISRRRFLTMMAACAASPAAASPVRWHGRALGANAEIMLYGPRDWATPLLQRAERTLRDVESLFSLFDTASSLTRLNAAGTVRETDARFHRLLDLSDLVHGTTEGLFDPTVQPLWQALADGTDATTARRLIGWHRVTRDGNRIRLAPGQALTLNGIAQGFATDMIVELFRKAGAEKTLVNIGEFGSLGGPWRVGVSDPVHGLVAERTLSGTAIATSSPAALHLSDSESHILDPLGNDTKAWSTVSVEAGSAAIADGVSTAICHANLDTVQRVSERIPGLRRITLIDNAGDLITIRPG